MAIKGRGGAGQACNTSSKYRNKCYSLANFFLSFSKTVYHIVFLSVLQIFLALAKSQPYLSIYIKDDCWKMIYIHLRWSTFISDDLVYLRVLGKFSEINLQDFRGKLIQINITKPVEEFEKKWSQLKVWRVEEVKGGQPLSPGTRQRGPGFLVYKCEWWIYHESN